jgi:hypothetical protein
MQSPTQEYADVVTTSNHPVDLKEFDWKARDRICKEASQHVEKCGFPVTEMKVHPFGADHRGHINLLGLTLVGSDQTATKIIVLRQPVVRRNNKYITL